jgi:LacI family repressor for deo operon, udp, cdd, tsx, nupC, and nupG
MVDIDNRDGAREAVAYLIRQGHREIATITGPIEWASATARLEGYRRALKDASIAEEPGRVEIGEDWGLSAGQAAARRLLDGGRPFTGLFAQSDLLALGAISELRSDGLRIPDDVSVVGYDDIPVARFVDPPLTTIQQPMREVGAAAAAIVIESIMSGRNGATPPPVRQRIRAPLVIRSSVTSPRVVRVKQPA